MKKKYYIYLSFIFIIFNFEFYATKANAKDYSGTGKYRFGPNIAESTACDLAFERAKKMPLVMLLMNTFFHKILCIVQNQTMQNASLIKPLSVPLMEGLKKLRSNNER